MKPILVVLSFAAFALFASNAQADQWNHHWSVGPNPELHITAGDAAVVVEAGNASGIDATLTTRGWSLGESGVRVTEHQEGNRVEIDIRVPSVHFSFGNRSIRLEVRVPRELTGDIHTGDGSIRLAGLHGSIRADTGDGSIQGEDLDGTLDVHSGDGSVHLTGRFDNIQLRTDDGSVELNALRGSRMHSDWRVQTGDGSVHLNLPTDLSADLELHTGDGHIQSDLPLTVTGMQSEHDIRGKLNGGGPALTVRTGDGSITVGSA
jgi:Putative adhesin